MGQAFSSSSRGCVRQGLPWSLDRHDPVSIGSDCGCTIVIEGAALRHAELCWNAEERAWAIHALSPAETLVNGQSVSQKRLFERDLIDIAGVLIRYADGRLQAEHRADGLCVCVRNVSATAGGKRLLDNVSFRAEEGSFIALLGPSGCGKSTLIQRIAGLAPFDGEVLFNGHSISTEKDSLLPLVAYLPQSVEDSLHADMTVEEAIVDFVRCHLAKGDEPDFTAKLKEVELDYAKLKATPVRQLSGGMKRRLALALALMRNPQLLLLDEPTAGLDLASEVSIMALLRRISDQGCTILCATHVLSSLDRCDRVVVLAPGGHQAFFGTPTDAFAHFGVQDWLSVYCALDAGKWEPWWPQIASVPCPKPCVRKLSDASRAASFASYFRATFGRLWRTVCVKRNACLFFGSPIVIALVLAGVCGGMFGENDSWETVCFCMAVAMFWMGLSGSVRSLVSERDPKRCLDRMRGVPLLRYFSAHIAFVALSALVQSFLFVLPVFLWRQDPTYFSWFAFPVFWFVLAVICFAGGSVGLAVSAGAKKEIHAVWWLPLVAIFALFLSKPVLNAGKAEGAADSRVVAVSSWLMPTIHAQECLDAELERWRVVGKQPEEYARKFSFFLLVPGIAYPVLFLPLAFFLQKRREEQWDGR